MGLVDKILLAPYYLALRHRHRLYDEGTKIVHTASVPTLCIGNITVGGTGKTPFAELVLRTLAAQGFDRVALLSRGYKRKTTGYRDVETTGRAEDFGDEPLQIKRKFPETAVAVCIEREVGCEKLAQAGAGLIILDDAFQYRGLKATKSIVLIDYSRPIWKDHLLPLGRLRDLPQRVAAADLVVVTKCPRYDFDASLLWVPNEREKCAAELSKLGYNGEIFFTTITIGALKPVFPESAETRYAYAQTAIALSAIAGNKAFARDLSREKEIVASMRFHDHHAFSKRDCAAINALAAKHPLTVIVTTEKDTVRLLDAAEWLSDDVKKRLMVQPISTEFLHYEDQQKFQEFIHQLI